MGFFQKIVDFANRFYKPKTRKGDKRPSRFDDLKKELSAGAGDDKDGVEAAIDLCDEALDIVSDRAILLSRLKAVEEKLAEVESYNKLTDEEIQDLKDMIAQFLSLNRDSNALRYQVTSFDPGLMKLERYAHEAPAVIPEIKYAEERQKLFKKDMNYLAGERTVLEHDNERIKNAIDFVYKFTIGIVLFFSSLAALMAFLYIFRNMQTMVVMALMLVVIIVIASLLYALRVRLKQELALNYRKQRRAVELLNKKTIVYAHFTNFLNYEYRKFKVRNADMLAANLNDYNHYKHLTKRLDALRNSLHQSEASLELFLKSKGIVANFSNMVRFAESLNIDDKRYYYNETARERAMIESTLKKLDARHSVIWDNLSVLNKADQSADGHVDRIIKSYIEKAAEIFEKNDMEASTINYSDELVMPLAEAELEGLEFEEVMGEVVIKELGHDEEEL